MRKTLVVVALALAAGGVLAKQQGKYRITTADQVQFKDAEGLAGVQLAPLWGDMGKGGDSGTLVKFEAGTDMGWHTHTNRIHLVMLSGTLEITPEGGEPTELTTGAYADDPGKVRHRTVCKEGEDCVFVLHLSKKFDFLKAQAPAAKK
jgi:quercetin dioxygenase-like cupin family protein